MRDVLPDQSDSVRQQARSAHRHADTHICVHTRLAVCNTLPTLHTYCFVYRIALPMIIVLSLIGHWYGTNWLLIGY